MAGVVGKEQVNCPNGLALALITSASQTFNVVHVDVVSLVDIGGRPTDDLAVLHDVFPFWYSLQGKFVTEPNRFPYVLFPRFLPQPDLDCFAFFDVR